MKRFLRNTILIFTSCFAVNHAHSQNLEQKSVINAELIGLSKAIINDACNELSPSADLPQSSHDKLIAMGFKKKGGGFGSKATIFEKKLANGDDIYLRVGRNIYYEPIRCKLIIIGEDIGETYRAFQDEVFSLESNYIKNGVASDGIHTINFYTKQIKKDEITASISLLKEKFGAKKERISLDWDINTPPTADRDAYSLINLTMKNCIDMTSIIPKEFISANSASFDSVVQIENETLKIENSKKYPRFTLKITPSSKKCTLVMRENSNATDIARDDLIGALNADSRFEKTIVRAKVNPLGYVQPTDASRIDVFSFKSDAPISENSENKFIIKYSEYGLGKIFSFGTGQKIY